MLDFQYILFSQYPALLLLSFLFLIANLRARKKSTVRSILWSVLFAVSLAASLVLCFLGLNAKYWTLRTLLPFPLWSWCGIVLVVFFTLLRIAHAIESSLQRRKLARELKKAEADKEAAVAQARQAGRAEALSSVSPPSDEETAAAPSPIAEDGGDLAAPRPCADNTAEHKA